MYGVGTSSRFFFFSDWKTWNYLSTRRCSEFAVFWWDLNWLGWHGHGKRHASSKLITLALRVCPWYSCHHFQNSQTGRVGKAWSWVRQGGFSKYWPCIYRKLLLYDASKELPQINTLVLEKKKKKKGFCQKSFGCTNIARHWTENTVLQ